MSIGINEIPDPAPEGAPEVESRGENALELKEVEGLSQGKIVVRRFMRHRGAA